MAINIYAIVTPIILALIAIEFFYCLKVRNGYYNFQDSIASLGTAIGNQTVNLIVGVLIYYFFGFLTLHFGIFDIQPRWYNFLILYLLIDFLFYWFHRAGHTINIMWAAHMPHHSTEELNYAVALRASVTQRLFSFIFYWPLAIIGFSPEMILPTVALHLVIQFVPHTRVIPNLGPWIESWLNTPSHHRVHHAINKQYINKNYAGTFIIWDRMFGTFEPEVEEPFYGVTEPPRTWDPIKINFQTWNELVRDAYHAPHFIDKIKIWFMPTGWRPRGLLPKEEMPEITAATQQKYVSTPLNGAKSYLLAHLPFSFFLLLFMARDDSFLTGFEKVVFGILIWMMVIVWGGMLESKRWAISLEITRLILLMMCLVFVLNKYSVSAVIIAPLCFIALIFLAWCFVLMKQNAQGFAYTETKSTV